MIQFKNKICTSVYHDPTKNFELSKVEIQKRYDPLTGRMVRIFPFRSMTFPRHDWTPFVEESKQGFCPFCPGAVEKVTPRFPEDFIPGGMIKCGQSVLVPNLHPYETHTGVVIMTPTHYLSMEDITVEVMTDGMEAGLNYLKIIAEKDPDNAKYCNINWNYMPYAGGSIIHPHLQIISGADPCNLDREMIEAAAKYYENNGKVYWHDLIEAEKNGERHLGTTGQIEWLASFAPLTMGDVTAVLEGCSTIYDITRQTLADLATGLRKVISYYDHANFPAFNMALYFAGREAEGFCCTARMVGRYTLFPLVGSDVSHMQMLHMDPWSLLNPEDMAVEIRKFFK